MSPYRISQPPPPVELTEGPGEQCPDLDLISLFVVCWFGCLIWAVVVPGAALPMVGLVVLPYALRESLYWCFSRCFSPRGRREQLTA